MKKISQKPKPKQKSKNSNSKKNVGRMRMVPTMPISYAQEVKTREPRFGNATNVVRVAHTEMLAEVPSDEYFVVNYYTVNAAQLATFPWLSSIARRFERYRFVGLKFHFEPTCPTTTAGYFAMYLDYNATDSGPDTYQAFMANNGAITGPLYHSHQISVNPSLVRERGFLFTRDDFTSSTGGLLNYDLATLYYVCVSSDTLGKGALYVTYEVELMQPQLRTHLDTAYLDHQYEEEKGGASTSKDIFSNLSLENLTGTGLFNELIGSYHYLKNASERARSYIVNIMTDAAHTYDRIVIRNPQGIENTFQTDQSGIVRFVGSGTNKSAALFNLAAGYAARLELKEDPASNMRVLISECLGSCMDGYLSAYSARPPEQDWTDVAEEKSSPAIAPPRKFNPQR